MPNNQKKYTINLEIKEDDDLVRTSADVKASFPQPEVKVIIKGYYKNGKLLKTSLTSIDVVNIIVSHITLDLMKKKYKETIITNEVIH